MKTKTYLTIMSVCCIIIAICTIIVAVLNLTGAAKEPVLLILCSIMSLISAMGIFLLVTKQQKERKKDDNDQK